MEETQQRAAPAPEAASFHHTVERKPGSIAVLSVQVHADRLVRASDRAFDRHVRQAKIPGFRPGKAPRAIYERTYGTEHLWAEAAEDLVDETYREILQREGLSPLERPSVEITQLEPGKPFAYTATVPVSPEVELGDYAAHGAAVAPEPVTDEEVERTIAGMREHHAELRPVERAARSGDVLTVDVDVTLDGRQLPPFGRNAHIELGREYVINGLAEGLVGVRAGEERTLDLGFPDDYPGEDLRGKSGRFVVRVSQVAEKILPELDDEFAKTVGVADLTTLRRTARNELAHAAFHDARDAAAEKLVDHLVACATVEVPALLVQDELDHMVRNLRSRLTAQGVSWEQFLLQARKTEDELRADWRPAAERRATSLLVLDAVARKEGVTVSSTELAHEVALMPLAQQDARALRDPAVLAALARSMRNRKAVDKLIGLASPDAEREAIRRAGGEPDEVVETAAPAIEIPARSGHTAEGRAAIRALLSKK